MWVPPHPHTGLQTVTWLFEGTGLHTDSLGSRQLVRPGQLNVMTAGHGICHAEVSPDDAPALLHGVQLWVCLPDGVRDSTPPAFTHLPDLPTHEEHGTRVRVLVGSLAGETSTAPAYTPLVGAELTLEPGATAVLPLEPSFEYGVLVVQGSVEVDGIGVERNAMSYLGAGRRELSFRATGEEPTVLMLLGGEPFEEDIVMWWNFIGRSHDEVVGYRTQWQADVVGGGSEDGRFGRVRGYDGPPLPAPTLPNVRLRPRG
jgi:quercetin 2,3-dioxygenase